MMPVKIAKSAPRASFGLPELLVTSTPRVSLATRPEGVNIHASSGVIREPRMNAFKCDEKALKFASAFPASRRRSR